MSVELAVILGSLSHYKEATKLCRNAETTTKENIALNSCIKAGSQKRIARPPVLV